MYIKNKYPNIISIVNDYPVLFLLLFASNALSGLLNCFVRGIDKVKEVDGTNENWEDDF